MHRRPQCTGLLRFGAVFFMGRFCHGFCARSRALSLVIQRLSSDQNSKSTANFTTKQVILLSLILIIIVSQGIEGYLVEYFYLMDQG